MGQKVAINRAGRLVRLFFQGGGGGAALVAKASAFKAWPEAAWNAFNHGFSVFCGHGCSVLGALFVVVKRPEYLGTSFLRGPQFDMNNEET